jgi:hypothetical protein
MSEKLECPQCGSSACVVKVANQHFCNQCCISFAHDRQPISTRANESKAALRNGGKPRLPIDALLGS